ncbi:MAG: HDOD domain-containing protein [Deltaproteobacteria bacterium]|jgi:HD-like signal output (HDOD) protein|nr:HDOD domain-containing protein [Deltaproteobacteria bacterium]
MEAGRKRRILFVDDEKLLLKGLQRMLRSMRHEWEMRFVIDGRAALALINEEPFDAVITDMQMPGMNGIQLLEKIMQDHPDTVRIILSGQLDQEMILKTVRSAHQHLSKPCDADLLKSTLAQAFALRDLLADEKIQKLVSRIESLPSLPSLYIEITEELQAANTSFNKVGEIIAKDVGMTAKILQMVNSAFFGLRRQISNPRDAVSYLGFETIKSLVLSAKIFSQFDQKKLPGFSLDGLWNHSMMTGTFAKIVAELEGQAKEVIDDAYMVGLLHDLGKLILVQNLSDSYQEALEAASKDNRALWEVESEMLGATHAEIAAYLMGLWGIKYPVVEAIAFHHTPGKSNARMGILIIVHSANALAHEMQSLQTPEPARLDNRYLGDMDIMERFPAWQAACQKYIQRGENLEG